MSEEKQVIYWMFENPWTMTTSASHNNCSHRRCNLLFFKIFVKKYLFHVLINKSINKIWHRSVEVAGSC